MHLAYHGGKCCGIKTIYGFNSNPECLVDEIDDYIDIEECDRDSSGDHVASDGRFFHATAPRETGVERLDRYLRYLDQRRPGGVVEIVLADYSYVPSFNKAWWPVLEERGFTKTAEFKNSNSNNPVTIYHRVKSADNAEQEDAEDFAYEWDKAEGVDPSVIPAKPEGEYCDCCCDVLLEDL